MLEILAIGEWTFGGGIQAAQRLEGQLTKCRWFGIVFYVRENIDNHFSFYVSSNERMQEKGSNRGTTGPARHRQILDLCTAKDADWQIAADVIRCLDHLRRPISRNRRFTVAWAERQLKQPAA